MKLVIFGLTISSSWGNGHATLWRGLCRALGERGHDVAFFEADRIYYATHRDLATLPGDGRLFVYTDWRLGQEHARRELADADAIIITSYCTDALKAHALAREIGVPLRVFYDLDTPVTLDALRNGPVDYIGADGLRDYDLVLSYTGGEALRELQSHLGARHVAPLYGSVDPAAHRPAPREERFACDLSYLGTYAADRQGTLEKLFIEPARCRPHQRFLIGGAQYPPSFPWAPNIYFVQHLEPAQHPAFFSSSRLTLNITRRAMKRMGYCPSGRLFEAAACGAPLVSDAWEGLEQFFMPGREIIVARGAEDVTRALDADDAELARIAAAARERVLAEHTAAHRAQELEQLLERAFAARHATPATSEN